MSRDEPALSPLRSHCRPPEAGVWCVERDRVGVALDASVERCRVVEVVAPGGFGKSTALADWTRSRSGASAWITLTSHTVNPDRLADLINLSLVEVARGRPGFEALGALAVQGVKQGRSASLVSSWLEALEALPEPLVLVVDDAHVVPGILQRGPIGALVESRAANLSLVLASRAQVEGLDLLRARGEAGLIGADTLRFRAEEVMEVARASGTELTERDAGQIMANTGGWPVAVRLDLLTPGADLPASRDSLRGYIEVELLGRLSEELRHLVFSTVALERFTGRSAREISELAEAEKMLEELMARGMFLTRTRDEDGRIWYRWHARFARECREVLRERRPDDFVRVSRAVVHMLWYRDPLAALVVAQEAEAGDLVRSLLAEHWLPLLLAGDHEALESGLESLRPTLRRDPIMMVVESALKDLGGHRTLASILLDRAEVESRSDPGVVRLALAQGRILLSDDPADLGKACDTAEEVLRTALVPGTAMHDATVFLLGWAELRLRRDPLRSLELLGTAGLLAERRGDRLLATRAYANAAFAAAFLGDFRVAQEQIAKLGPAAPGPDLWEVYDGGIRDFTEGWIAYWTGDLATAEEKFETVIERHGVHAYAPLARVLYTWVACATGDPRRVDRAEQVRREIPVTDEHGVPWGHYSQMAKAKILAARGAPPHLVAEAALQAVSRANTPVILLDAAWLLLRAGRTADLVDQLRRLSPLERQPVHVQVGALVINALVQRKRGQHESAHRLLERSLDQAADLGLRRAYDLTVPGMGALLAAHAAQGTAHPEFVASVMASSTTLVGESPAAALSARERVVLQYMRGTLSNAEIAEALHVSVNTVKTHQRSIYRKFGVATRREAVRLAGAGSR